MRSIRPDKDICVRKMIIPSGKRKIPALVLSPRETPVHATGILWLHGGGYIAGMKEMVHMSRAVDLVKQFGAVVVSPGYRLAPLAPYPAAFDDCYAALLYLKAHAVELGVRDDQLMVGGESAGGGLCAAVCIRARDTGAVNIAFQMPLYPMLDDRDTESSRNNHGKVWNTRKNHFAWRCYLRGQDRQNLPPYAAPARLTDFAGMPLCGLTNSLPMRKRITLRRRNRADKRPLRFALSASAAVGSMMFQNDAARIARKRSCASWAQSKKSKPFGLDFLIAERENRLFFASEERCAFPMRLQRICAAVTDLPRNRKQRNQDMPGVGTEKRPLLIVDGKLLFRDHFQKRQFFHHTVCLLTANTAVTRKNRTFKNIIFASAV